MISGVLGFSRRGLGCQKEVPGDWGIVSNLKGSDKGQGRQQG